MPYKILFRWDLECLLLVLLKCVYTIVVSEEPLTTAKRCLEPSRCTTLYPLFSFLNRLNFILTALLSELHHQQRGVYEEGATEEHTRQPGTGIDI